MSDAKSKSGAMRSLLGETRKDDRCPLHDVPQAARYSCGCELASSGRVSAPADVRKGACANPGSNTGIGSWPHNSLVSRVYEYRQELIDRLNSGSRHYVAMRQDLDSMISFQMAADKLAGHIK